MDHFSWRSITLILLSLLAAACAQTSGMQEIKPSRIEAYLRPFGYQSDSIDNYWQDTNGRTLYIPDGDLLKGYSVFLLTPDEPPKRISLPMNNPLKTYWVDPHGGIRYLPSYAYSETNRDVGTLLDDQSGFFFQDTGDKVVHVGRMEQSNGWLFEVKETDQFIVGQICVRGDIVYLLDHTNRADPSFAFSKVNCWAFAPDPKSSGHYVKVDQFSVPGRVRIVDPFSQRFICDGYGNMPFPGHPFLYDVKKHEIVESLPWDQLIVFLDGDWLSSRLKN